MCCLNYIETYLQCNILNSMFINSFSGALTGSDSLTKLTVVETQEERYQNSLIVLFIDVMFGSFT